MMISRADWPLASEDAQKCEVTSIDELSDLYVSLGEAEGWFMPRIAPYHQGPFRVVLILADPGGEFTAGSGAERSREIGFRNDDPTARFVADAAKRAGLAEAEILPLNALAGYGLKPNDRNLRISAGINSEICALTHARVAILGGKLAKNSRSYLSLGPDWNVLEMPHPSARGRGRCTSQGLDGSDLVRRTFAEAARFSAPRVAHEVVSNGGSR